MNFRDLGGAEVPGGMVARGRLFRTGHLSRIDEAAAAHIAEFLRIGAYIDFRTEQETIRDGLPAPLLARGVRWVRHPFDISDETFRAVRRPTASDWEAVYFRAVRRLGREFAGALQLISVERAPVAFGCWVGKDRTGMVAALLLSVLGVDEDAIAEDYARTTESLLPFRSRFASLWEQEPEAAAELFAAYNTAEPQVIAGFLHSVRTHFGSVERALDLPRDTVERLRARCVTARSGE